MEGTIAQYLYGIYLPVDKVVRFCKGVRMAKDSSSKSMLTGRRDITRVEMRRGVVVEEVAVQGRVRARRRGGNASMR